MKHVNDMPHFNINYTVGKTIEKEPKIQYDFRTSMKKLIVIKIVAMLTILAAVYAFNCRELLQDVEIKYMDWHNLEQCLAEVNSENIPKNTSENIWRLIKVTFDGIENIPPEAYKKLGLSLVAIPTEELRNVSMEQVETIEAFGAIRQTDMMQGFTEERFMIIAQKVRDEWSGKNPQTYSEYDLITMGEIVCHLNVSDIAEIHADAFKAAAESIGSINNCPQQQLQAFAKLAIRSDAFGEPKEWTTLDVSTIGNIINGLASGELAAIDRNKLHLNRYYAQKNKNGTRARANGAENNSLNTGNKTLVAQNGVEQQQKS